MSKYFFRVTYDFFVFSNFFDIFNTLIKYQNLSKILLASSYFWDTSKEPQFLSEKNIKLIRLAKLFEKHCQVTADGLSFTVYRSRCLL